MEVLFIDKTIGNTKNLDIINSTETYFKQLKANFMLYIF